MKTTTKSLEYACPRSDNAKKFGYYENGCWSVVIRGAESNTIIAEKAFASKSEAAEAFNSTSRKKQTNKKGT